MGSRGPYTKLSERHEESKRIFFALLVDAGEGDPRAEVAFDTDTLRQPRKNWVVETSKEFWSKRVKEEFRGTAVGDLDWNTVEHREMVKHTARGDAQKIRLMRMARKRG